MIAIPIKMQKMDSALSPLFGKAKYFAFIDDKAEITIEKNSLQSGKKIINYFFEKGVKTIILNHIGEKPFLFLEKKSMQCFFGGKEPITINEILEKYNANQLIQITNENFSSYIERNHKCAIQEKKEKYHHLSH